VNHINQVEAHV